MSEEYEVSRIGNHIYCQLTGINQNILNNPDRLTAIIKRGLVRDNFGVIKMAGHKFESQGFSLSIILEESHLDASTFPEEGFETLKLDFYTCRGFLDGRNALNYIFKKLKPGKISMLEQAVVQTRDFPALPLYVGALGYEEGQVTYGILALDEEELKKYVSEGEIKKLTHAVQVFYDL